MMVRVRITDVDGIPAEVAEVIERMVRQERMTREEAHSLVVDRIAKAIDDPVIKAAPQIEAREITQQPVMPGPADLAAAMYDAAGVDGGPFHDWMDIPESLRAWNANGSICHVVRDPADPTATACGHELGMLRDPRRAPMNDARVCAACNRALERARRNDT